MDVRSVARQDRQLHGKVKATYKTVAVTKALSPLSQKSETVAENGDSHFSATMWTDRA